MLKIKMHGKNCLDGHLFIQSLSYKDNNFMEDFMKPFKNEFKWNDFFQFVVYFALAPMIAIAYASVNILTDVKDVVTQEHLLHICAKLQTREFVDCSFTGLFKKCQKKSRKNNGITFTQFFNLFDKTFILWEPLYKFHLSVLQTFFPDDFYKQILNRKLNIDSIKEYRENHNNNFPPVRHKCIDKLLSLLFDTPNPNIFNYDYQFYQSYKYRDFAKNLIRKYRADIMNVKIQFRMNHLNNKTKYLVINDIDKMYISFNTYGMKGMDMMITSPANSRRGSLNSNSSFSNYSFRNTSKGSILRGGSVKFSAATSKLCNNCGGLSPAHVSRMRGTSNCCGGFSPNQYISSLPTSPNANNLYKKRKLKECSIELKDLEEEK